MASLSPVTLIRPTPLGRTPEWRELDNWNWRQKLSFVSSGVLAELRVTEPAAMALIKLRLPPGWRPSNLSGNGPRYSVVVGNEVAPPGFERLNMLFRGALLIAAAYELEPVMGALEADLDLQLARLAAPERIFIEAGVVEWRGQAIVIVGRRQSGISTLVAELLRAGATFYSDRYAVLDPDGWVHPFARPLWLEVAGGVHPVRCRAEKLRAKVGTQPRPIGVVVVTRYLPKSRARLAPLTASVAAAELMINTTSAENYPEETLAGITKSLSTAWILKGVRGEAREIVPILMNGSRSQTA